jgi:hypothetical protein
LKTWSHGKPWLYNYKVKCKKLVYPSQNNKLLGIFNDWQSIESQYIYYQMIWCYIVCYYDDNIFP